MRKPCPTPGTIIHNALPYFVTLVKSRNPSPDQGNLLSGAIGSGEPMMILEALEVQEESNYVAVKAITKKGLVGWTLLYWKEEIGEWTL